MMQKLTKIKQLLSFALIGILMLTTAIGTTYAAGMDELDPEAYDIEALESGRNDQDTDMQLAQDREPNAIIIKFHPESMFPGREHQYRMAVEQVLRWGFEYTPVDGLEDTYVVFSDELEKNPNAVMNRFKNNRFVEYVEPNFLLRFDRVPNDANYPGRAALAASIINAEGGWAIITDSRVPIAIVDSGYNRGSDLPAANVYNVLDKSSNVSDAFGHGTQVAGTVGAIGNNAIGNTGVVWNANLMPVKISDTSTANVANVASGIVWAADNGARVINVSLGTAADSATLRNAIDHAYRKGAVIVASAGNSGTGSLSFPAAYSNVLGVGSTSSGTARDHTSNFGNGLDVMGSILWNTTTASGGFTNASGTSIAAPQVAGLAALVWELAPNLSNAQVMQLIRDNTNRADGRWDSQTGFGTIDMGRTLAAARDLDGTANVNPAPEPAPSVPQPPSISPIGSSLIVLHLGSDTPYTEQGARAICEVDGDISHKVVINGSVDRNKAGTYTLTYSVTNSQGLTASVQRNVVVLAATERNQPREVYTFNEQAKKGDRPVTRTITAGTDGLVDLGISGISKFSVRVTLTNNSGSVVFQETFSANASRSIQLAAGNYTVASEVTDGNGNNKYTITAAMPAASFAEFAQQEVPLATWNAQRSTTAEYVLVVFVISLLGACVISSTKKVRRKTK